MIKQRVVKRGDWPHTSPREHGQWTAASKTEHCQMLCENMTRFDNTTQYLTHRSRFADANMKITAVTSCISKATTDDTSHIVFRIILSIVFKSLTGKYPLDQVYLSSSPWLQGHEENKGLLSRAKSHPCYNVTHKSKISYHLEFF